MRQRQIGRAMWPKSLRNDAVAEKGLNFGHAGVWRVGCRCKSIGRWGTLNWIFPAGWSYIPYVTRRHGRNSVLFRQPLHFEGTLATSLARSDAASLFLMGISERESLPKQTTNHRRLERKLHQRNSGSDSGRTGKDFPKYGAPGSILSGRKCWPRPAHVMMSHFSHNERTPVQISLQYLHWC